MLTLTVPEQELFNQETQKFFTLDSVQLELEHSLASLSKWEEIWEKPYLPKGPGSPKELRSYIECMILTPNLPRGTVDRLSEPQLAEVLAYMGGRHTATWFNEPPGSKPSREVITAEIIYYWMTSWQIPWEAQYWHLNKLIALIKVHGMKNNTGKKMSKKDVYAQQAAINEANRKKYNSNG